MRNEVVYRFVTGYQIGLERYIKLMRRMCFVGGKTDTGRKQKKDNDGDGENDPSLVLLELSD